MTKFAFILPILTLTACATAEPAAPAPAAAPPSADDLLARVEAKMAELDTLRAKLTHVTIQGLLGDEQRRFGTLVYDDPDPEGSASGAGVGGDPAKFAIRFDREAVDGQLRPQERSYRFDGRWLAEVLPAEKLFIRRELVAEGDASAGDPLALGEGPFALPLNLQRDKLAQRFDVATIDEPDAEVPGALGLRLTPRPGADLDQVWIDLWFDRDSLLPVKVESLEDDETRQIIYLREPEMNPALDGETFDTTAPSGGGWQVEEHRLQP